MSGFRIWRGRSVEADAQDEFFVLQTRDYRETRVTYAVDGPFETEEEARTALLRLESNHAS